MAPELERQSLAAAAHAAIRRDIIRCQLLPGVELTEHELASRYGFGKTPIREALGRLVHEGLVSVLPRRGYRVSPVTIKSVQDVFAVRLLLETEAARLAAGRVDGNQLRRLDQLCSAGYDPANSESAAAFLEANTEFHLTVARASGNERLTAILAQILDEMERLFHLGLRLRNRTEEMAHEHKALVDALLAGDGQSAATIAAAQVHAAQRMVMDGLLSSPQIMSVNLAVLP